jgi:hypothetical protein
MQPGSTRTLVGWLIAATLIYAFVMVIVALFDGLQVVENLQPHAAIPLTLQASTVLPPHSGSLHYAGSAYVAQDYQVTATEVSLDARGVPLFSIILMGIGHIVADLSAAAIAYIFCHLLRKIRDGNPFIESASRLLVTAGILVAGGLTLGDVLIQLGQISVGPIAYIVSHYDFEAGGGNFTLNFVPIVFGLLLLVVAFVFRQGTKLQRETEGLV